MVLVFDMVSSCWRQVVVPDSKQRFVGFIPVTGLIAPNFQRAHGRNSRHTRHRIETDRDGECRDEFFLLPSSLLPRPLACSGG
jgi:hypothetical protein